MDQKEINLIREKVSTRRDDIDMTKGIAIILMVLCHCGFHNVVTVWIYSFHMPLFFIVSGFLLHEKSVRTIRANVQRKIRAIMIPYFMFSLIYCFGCGGLQDWGCVFYGSRNSLYFVKCYTPLWFLPCFFLSSILFDIFKRIPNNLLFNIICVVSGAFGILLSNLSFKPALGWPFSLDAAFVGVSLMWIGSMIGSMACHNSSFKIVERKFIFCLMGGIGSVVGLINRPVSLTQGLNHIEMSIGSFGNPVMFYISATLITLFLIMLCGLFNIKIKFSKAIYYCGRNSLAILCVHSLLISIVNIFIKILHLEIDTFVLPCFKALLVLMVSVPLIIFFKKYIPCAVGRYQA